MKTKSLLLLILFWASFPVTGQKLYDIEWQDCFLERCDHDVLSRIKFGHLTVPEDYSKPDGRKIKVAFTLIKSADSEPKPDPIIVFAGGWGMPELESTMGYAKNFPIKNRDLILYDYRGSGHSQPQLCPELGEQIWESMAVDLSLSEFEKRIRDFSSDCLEGLRNQDIDVNQYGTETKTRDAVELLKALDIDTINLFGISNGTMGIQGFLRNAEDSNLNVRSILSDSNVPMTTLTQGEMLKWYTQSLFQVLDDCEKNPECNEAYPDLKQRFRLFLKESKEKPLVYNGKSRMVFNDYEINGIVHQLLYDSANYKDIPLLLETLMSRDIDFVGLQYDRFKSLVASQNGTSIINYTYDWNFYKEEGYRNYKMLLAKSREYMPVDLYIDFYGKDSLLQFNPRDTIPVISTAPALVLAGEYDPITPPSWSKVMHERYKNSYYVELPKVGHGAVITACGMNVYQTFLENPKEEPPSTCVEDAVKKTITFTITYYDNPKMAEFAIGLFRQKNVFLVAIVSIAFLAAMILFVMKCIKAIRRKGFDAVLWAQGLLILVFLGVLLFYIKTTFAQGGLLLAFGLVSSAKWLPWLAVLITVLMIAGITSFIKKKKFGFGQVLFTVASISVCILFLGYGLLPF